MLTGIGAERADVGCGGVWHEERVGPEVRAGFALAADHRRGGESAHRHPLAPGTDLLAIRLWSPREVNPAGEGPLFPRHGWAGVRSRRAGRHPSPSHTISVVRVSDGSTGSPGSREHAVSSGSFGWPAKAAAVQRPAGAAGPTVLDTQKSASIRPCGRTRGQISAGRDSWVTWAGFQPE